MTATPQQAENEMLAFFKTAWDTTGFGANVAYENVPPADGAEIPPDTAAPWARVTVRNNTARQATLADTAGQRLFEKQGILTIQVFVPSGEGLSRGRSLAKVVSDAFEGNATSPGRVWFRNVRINEIGPDGNWFQINVIVEFTYNELR